MPITLLDKLFFRSKVFESETHGCGNISFNRKHLEKFTSTVEEELTEFPGFVPSKWWQHVSKSLKIQPNLDLPDVRVSRQNLIDFSQKREFDDLHFSVCILAWGGMNRKHGAMALNHFEHWHPILSSLREGRISWRDAYSYFSKLRTKSLLPGMGPAYFTKLIFFGCAGREGYIMDQWTGRSINLLTNRQVVNLSWSSYRGRTSAQVSDQNTVRNYEEFCTLVDELSTIVGEGKTGCEIEAALFSEGRGKGNWRRYVKANTP